MSKYKANRELYDELTKRFMLVNKAHQQVLVGNYGIAKKLLGKVLYEELKVEIMDD